MAQSGDYYLLNVEEEEADHLVQCLFPLLCTQYENEDDTWQLELCKQFSHIVCGAHPICYYIMMEHMPCT